MIRIARIRFFHRCKIISYILRAQTNTYRQYGRERSYLSFTKDRINNKAPVVRQIFILLPGPRNNLSPFEGVTSPSSSSSSSSRREIWSIIQLARSVIAVRSSNLNIGYHFYVSALIDCRGLNFERRFAWDPMIKDRIINHVSLIKTIINRQRPEREREKEHAPFVARRGKLVSLAKTASHFTVKLLIDLYWSIWLVNWEKFCCLFLSKPF